MSSEQERAWRAYFVGSSLLAYQLNRELQEARDITLPDYEILVRLSQSPDRRMRMSQLAGEVASSKSRVSHQINRMENAGLVRRMECPSDGRGVFAVLTDQGMDLLRSAAPTHVAGVRAHLIDLLDEEEQAVLGKVFTRITDHFGGEL
ncbi:MarR family transcriptional regulator [Actinoalloteichus sp. AHMU CJ021]|uniref:Transcriptional regulator, MarR family n=1 Tax=Actinoalloteichus caeruleus DSM 43889 TaxID=1120930 RepID=A0ABT1JKC4_ACTCY|nr:MarR family transcriptional regulator [Actinoalloteichus sp. AHMU CJ021]MCP2332792.1 transcriptional regulator, MarR family [Actinoalloteichus caeruleus DSM 43889]